MKKMFSLAALAAVIATPAFAHPGHGVESFAAGIAHPLGGVDHVAAMVAVGLWAALKGSRALWAWPAAFVGVMLIGGAFGMAHVALPFVEPGILASVVVLGLWAALKGSRALWAWPAAFVGVMLIGGALGMAHVALPFVEPGILASVVVLGLMVALAVDLPVAVGAAIVGAFALLHGHAHGTEVAENLGGVEYMAGFAIATATLHATGLGLALMTRRPLVRVAGAACVVLGVVLVLA